MALHYIPTCFFPFISYKQELQTAMEQHSQLERDKAQLDLDWQRRYEDLESNTYERSEDLIKSLTTAKNEVSVYVLLIWPIKDVTVILNK